MRWRHEWKHEIGPADAIVIRQRMGVVGMLDPHARDGCYGIRSVYFDNGADKALREKLDGVDKRQKWRIRLYDGDASLIHLERKSKQHDLGTKDSCELTAEEAQSIVDGNTSWMAFDKRPLVRALAADMACLGLRPRTIVDYVREPFIYPAGNVRVTIDRNIRTGLASTDFLNPQVPTVPVPGDPIILEVKWDDFLPSVVRDAVQLGARRTTSFSKYAICRSYD
ncbi:MAG: polyphosphate polymerase domain-containing protein [Coriobacteriales bacterium]|nr:polyphosphate polymerase domain-containing protein [Coriobacteriales bacterium]